MMWNEAGSKLAVLYGALADWVYANPVETDVIIGAAVVGSLMWYTKYARRMRSRSYRLLWGTLMKRKDREKYHKMKIEDAIVDACMEMVHHGDMTPAEEAKLYVKLSKSYDLAGLMPIRDQASVKRGIRFRLRTLLGLKPAKLPGDKPGGATDPNYKPEFEVARRGLATSKYATTET